MRPYACEVCGEAIGGSDLDAFIASLTEHVRGRHQWPYPDVAIRNFAEATQRVDGSTERLEVIGDVEIHRATAARLDDWLRFFDREAFAGNFAWASCYCAEPHCLDPKRLEETSGRTWQQNRSTMQELITADRSVGYLAYVGGYVAGWVNASVRSEYALHRAGEGAVPADDEVIGVACFVIAPPYRGHGLAPRLLDRVIADAASREKRWVEAYPFTDEGRAGAMGDFRGHEQMYLERGFDIVERRQRDLVVRLLVG